MSQDNQDDHLIKVGDYLVIQRQSFTKLHKLKANGTVSLGKDVVELENVIGKKYYSTFRMIPRPKNKRVYTLEEAEFTLSLQNVSIDKSGIDNRDIIDDGSSQQLSYEEIHKLRDDALSSSDIVEKLITNSKTFSVKTEYSQEKYLKKKEKKYFEYIQIRKPTLRLIAEIYHRLDPGKIQFIRIDDLSQMLSYANIHRDSNVLLYDSGTNGLLSSAVMTAIGAAGTGTLIHMHPGNVCQKEAFVALNFPSEQLDRCINVCLYSVLRCFHQEFCAANIKLESPETVKSEDLIQEVTNDENKAIEKTTDSIEKNNCDGVPNKKRKHSVDETLDKDAKRPCWQIHNENACRILINKVDAVIITTKEHPSNIVHELLPFLKYGKPFVIFNFIREPLQSLYVDLKSKANYIALRLSNSLLRNYQVLENRTHPDVNMNFGGYILTGFKVNVNNDE